MSFEERLSRLGRTFEQLADAMATQGLNAEWILKQWELDELPEEERRAVLRPENLRLLNHSLKLKEPGIEAVRRLSTDPPSWEIVGEEGTARATSSQLAEFRYAKVKIADATGQVPELLELGNPPKPIKWARMWRALQDAAERVDVGDLGTDRGVTLEALAGYHRDRPPLPRGDGGGEFDHFVLARRSSIEPDGSLTVYATDFLHWRRAARQDRITAKELAVEFHGIGAHPLTEHVTLDGRRTTISAYRLPQEVAKWIY